MHNRYELKYVIRWPEYRRLLEHIKPLTRLDGYARDGKYRIVSLYYDSHNLKFYWDKVNGYDNRLKVRVRHYDDRRPMEKVFLEIKEKDTETILKRRQGMHIDHAYGLLDRRLTLDDMSKTYGTQSRGIASEVITLVSLHCITPKIVVTYNRHSFVGLYDPRLRITFDTIVRYYDGRSLIQPFARERYAIHPEFVILEIKVAETVPAWLIDMIGGCELRQQPVSKYCLAMNRMLGHEEFLP